MSADRNTRPVEGGARCSRRSFQVDLLLQTKKSVCVVEVKRCGKIGVEVEDAVREKIRRIKLPRDISVRTALVYDGELEPTIEEDNYFDYLIPAERLFE